MSASGQAAAKLEARNRFEARFAALSDAGRGGLVTFVTAGDPDRAASTALLLGLAEAGADVIELGMPFSDPVADGPTIQLASERALAAGMTLRQTLQMVREFRARDDETPLVLMGYFNPIYSYGCEAFAADAAEAGVDGLIVVDLPPEEEAELRDPARAAGLDLVRLITPTTDDARLPKVLKDAGGFVYQVAVAGITGQKSGSDAAIEKALAAARRHTSLPIAVGFGIRTPAQAAEVARLADAVVVGSALVERLAEAGPDAALGLVAELAKAVRGARQ